MAAIETFTTEDTLPTIRAKWLYTLGRLQNNPHAKAFVDPYKAVGAMIDAAIQKQTALEDAVVLGQAARDAADEAIDELVVLVLAALLVVTKGDRLDPLYVSYAANQTQAEILRPVLGSELATVSEWVAPLKEEDDPALKSFGAALEPAVAAGKAAEKQLAAAEGALSDFRIVGDRKKVVDALNAARGALFGSLVEFQHSNTGLRLPKTWADDFFQHTTRVPKYGSTVAQAEAAVARAQRELAAAQAHLEELKKKEAAYEEAKQLREKARADLAAARAAKRAQLKQEKALEAEANKKLK
jgi:hypothetical protein